MVQILYTDGSCGIGEAIMMPNQETFTPYLFPYSLFSIQTLSSINLGAIFILHYLSLYWFYIFSYFINKYLKTVKVFQ